MRSMDRPDSRSRITSPRSKMHFGRPIALPLFEAQVPLSVVEAALLLASLRRLCRPSDLPPLPRVRSLAYFQPVIEELQANPVPHGYLGYLRLKLRSIVDKTDPAQVQKSTFSDDR